LLSRGTAFYDNRRFVLKEEGRSAPAENRSRQDAQDCRRQGNARRGYGGHRINSGRSLDSQDFSSRRDTKEACQESEGSRGVSGEGRSQTEGQKGVCGGW
jgi:hypothetical protein